jgi:hypothetical protein
LVSFCSNMNRNSREKNVELEVVSSLINDIANGGK